MKRVAECAEVTEIKKLRGAPDHDNLVSPALVDNDFAFLPYEIINDVLIIAGDKRDPDSDVRIHHQSLLQIDGPCGDFATDARPIKLLSSSMNRFSFNICGSNEELTFEEAIGRPIAYSEILNIADSDKLRQLAPYLYESIKLFYSANLSSSILDLLGDRFSTLEYLQAELKINDKMMGFFKRQLRSKYLRNLKIQRVNLREDKWTNLLMDFVQKPTFESLDCLRCVISPQVVFAAHKAWKLRTNFEVGYQRITGTFADSFTKELKTYFGMSAKQNPEKSSCHPVHHSATMSVKLEFVGFITLEFFNFENL